jgi:hypothetical protein
MLREPVLLAEEGSKSVTVGIMSAKSGCPIVRLRPARTTTSGRGKYLRLTDGYQPS